ncbi:MAG: hypothetical protein OXG78_09185 [Chloroflexi bacterium]|nr:hypothetical protein [Chloroflexota bacterium]
MVALFTLAALEGLLQLVFPHLPQALIEQMPQYLERSGFRLETEHGAREYPAGQIVDYEITRASGDLYKLTCLSPNDAPPFESYRVSFVRDSHGFRNAEPWLALTDLVIIGDSFVAAEAIVDPFWEGIVESKLVLGLPGSGAIEQQRVFETFAAPREPKTVVLAYFAGNDLKDNSMFTDLLAKGESYTDRTHQGKQAFEYSVLFNLILYLRQAFDTDSTPCHYPQAAQTSPPQPVAFYDEFLAVLRLDAETLRDSETFRLTSVSIAEMAAVQHARGDRFVLMYIPQKAELYWALLGEESKATVVSRLNRQFEISGGSVIDANLSAQRDLLAKLAEELGIEFLDLTPPLADAIADGLQPYFFADTHWNQVGHNIARIALLDQLNQSNLDR